MLVRGCPLFSPFVTMLTPPYSSCEYREGCEWREAKAREIAERFGVAHEEGSHEVESSGELSEESQDTDTSYRHKGTVDVAASMF